MATGIELGAPIDISLAQAATISEIAMRGAGIKIAPGKIDFIRTRLSRRLRETGCQDFASYLAILNSADGVQETQHLLESLTTHTTSFFRETAHYDWLGREGLPALVTQGVGIERPLTVWSAACSIGAELWTAAIVIEEFAELKQRRLRYDLLGTDISRRILRRAAAATFTEAEIAGLSEDMRKKYILRAKPSENRGQTAYRIVPKLRQNVRLLYANLLALDKAPTFAADVVFLRNVLIYFKPADQISVVEAVVGRIRPGGVLMTGHSESLPSGAAGLRQLGASIYVKD